MHDPRRWVAPILGALGVAVAPTMAFAQDVQPLTARDVVLRMRSGAPDRFFPQEAQEAKLQGRAAALCTIAANGDLTDCTVADEDPAGYRFGDAVVRLASWMRAGKKARDGSATAGRQILFRTTFTLPPESLR